MGVLRMFVLMFVVIGSTWTVDLILNIYIFFFLVFSFFLFFPLLSSYPYDGHLIIWTFANEGFQ